MNKSQKIKHPTEFKTHDDYLAWLDAWLASRSFDEALDLLAADSAAWAKILTEE